MYRNTGRWISLTILIGAAVGLSRQGNCQQTFLPPRQYYSPTWTYDGISPSFGPRYKSYYYWKVPNQNYYRRYECLYYANHPNWVHLYSSESGQWLKKCASHHHPQYNYWDNQWCDSDGPLGTDDDFDPNAPPTPGNQGTTIPRPPCPPDADGSPDLPAPVDP